MPFSHCPECGTVFYRAADRNYDWCPCCQEPLDGSHRLAHLPEPQTAPGRARLDGVRSGRRFSRDEVPTAG